MSGVSRLECSGDANRENTALLFLPPLTVILTFSFIHEYQFLKHLQQDFQYFKISMT